MHDVRHRHFATYVLLFLCAVGMSFFVAPYNAHAQINPTIGSTGISLLPNPEFPGPNTLTEISIDDYSIDTLGSSITWYINGVVSKEYQNARSIRLQTGDLGEKLTVQVVLSKSNALPLSQTLVIVPKIIDLILESNTYTPTFYAGRALPSQDATMRVIAVVHDNSTNMGSVYTYKWTLDDTVLLGGPIRGKNVIDIAMPHYEGSELIVDVYDTDGVIVGKNNISLTPIRPELHFYENSPLRGLSKKGLMSPFSLMGENTTVYGEPYYMSTRATTNDAIFTWSIDGEEVVHDDLAPNAITLERVGERGTANIGLHIVTRKTIPQFVEDTFDLIFE